MASYEQAKSILFNSVSRRTLYSISIQNRGRDGRTNPDKDLTRKEKEYLKLYANRITVPGISIKAMTALGQESMGIMRATPNEVRHGNNQLILQLIENTNFSAHDMMRKLFDQMAENANPRGQNRTIKMNYYNSYVRDIVVDKLEHPDGPTPLRGAVDTNDIDFGYKRVARYTFEKCYVNSIGEFVLDSGAFDDYISFPVVFSYESFHYDDTINYNDGKD
jgi:hypothetical protein